MYIKLINGIPENYSIGQLRADNPQTSFPAVIPDSTLADFDVYPLQATPQPQSDPLTEVVAETTAVKINGVWTQQWVVNRLPQDQADANVRSQRDGLLSESDWVVIKSVETEVPEIEAWKTYRQKLRDIPQQPGFPWNVSWPIKP